MGHSRQPPFAERPSNPEFREHYIANVEKHVQPILERHSILFESISFRRRRTRSEAYSEDENLHTLLISTKDLDTRAWKTAAEEIQEVFKRANMEYNVIEVEICNLERLHYNTSIPLPNNTQLLTAMQDVKPGIMELLIAACGEQWTSVAFHLRTARLISNAPAFPTVLVFFRNGARLDFDHIRLRLVEILGQSEIKLRLELLQGTITTNTRPNRQGKVLNYLPRRPENGSSIGVSGNSIEAGSLGGWMVLKFPKMPPRKVAVTCDHVVSPVSTQEDEVFKRPLSYTGASSSSMPAMEATYVEYPAALDRIRSFNYFKSNQESTAPIPRIKEDLEVLQQLEKDPIIGRVIAKSGLRINAAKRMMDWGLIESPTTYSKNKPPPASIFQRDEQFPDGLRERYTMTNDSEVRNIGRPLPGSWVTKRGRTSGSTSGIINHMTRLTKWHQHGGLVSEDIEVIGLCMDFAEGGDSGSMVLNQYGELVGLLFAKDSCSNDFGIGYITPIADIQQDVKAKTGGTLSLD